MLALGMGLSLEIRWLFPSKSSNFDVAEVSNLKSEEGCRFVINRRQKVLFEINS